MDNLLTHKIGPLPTVAWLAAGASILGFLIIIRQNGQSSTNASGGNVQMLSPTEAEAFGTIEQQQQDVTNALTTLGQNQAATGGSLSTLIGNSQTQWDYENSQFGSLAQAMAGLSQQQQSDTNSLASGQQYYYNSLLQNLQNAYNALSGQAQANQSALSGQIGQVGSQTAQVGQQQSAYYASLINYLQQMQAGLGGSIGTAKYEIAVLASHLGQGMPIAQALNQRGDYTVTVGQSGFGS